MSDYYSGQYIKDGNPVAFSTFANKVYDEDRNQFLNATLTSIMNMIYPVGSIYMSMNSTDPSTIFGGTWEQIQDTFLLSAGATYGVGTTGGEATHTLSIAEMPQHGHQVYVWDNAGTLGKAYYYNGNTKVTASSGRIYTSSAGTWVSSSPQAAGSGRGDPSGGTERVGSTSTHNNMPPYLVVYMWKRTA